MIKAVVTGATGRMGARIINVLSGVEGISLSGAVEKKGHPLVGQDAGGPAGLPPTGVMITDDLDAALAAGSVLIDFTSPEATLEHARVCADHHRPIVVGTTGFSKEEVAQVKKYTDKISCVLAPNMSIGVNLSFKILAEVAQALGDDYDVEIVEAHHRMKKDAPSGTAMKMAQVLSTALNRNLDEVGVFARKGIIGERSRKEIGVQTVRAGDIVGEHTVYFAGKGERIEITHRAHSRDTFAAGAVRAALWVSAKKSGMYDMQDVLGLK
ncbi:MAG TPA: 4-hydroxy-tetrahydrodipicolinate reductase [Nitrospiraceae bacterium]|nr:4-hydroxy-tetrahydrodipicolinate reductase [Nitrospiraceae bacterium]